MKLFDGIHDGIEIFAFSNLEHTGTFKKTTLLEEVTNKAVSYSLILSYT